MSWTETPVKDISLGIYDGPHATPKPADAGPVFLGIKNIGPDGRLDLNNIRHIAPAEFPRWTKRVQPRKDDIVFSYEATLHRYALIPDGFVGCLGRRLALVRPNPDIVDPRFLHYYFLSPRWFQTVGSVITTGSTVERIRLLPFPDLPVALPPLEAQSRIADTLVSYDALIENNNRRIALLEEATQQLYKEWFVRLRFPGYEHTRITNSLADGWARKPMSEIAEFRLGKMLDQKKNRGDLLPYLANVNVRWGSFDFDGLREMRFESHEIDKYSLKRGDIVMCEGGEPGRCAIWKEQVSGMMIQKALHRIRPQEGLDHRFLYHSLYHKGISGGLAGLFTGATIKHLPREKLAKVEIEIPPAELIDRFVEHVAPMEDQIGVLQNGIRRAAEARELLLPRLMSGELEL